MNKKLLGLMAIIFGIIMILLIIYVVFWHDFSGGGEMPADTSKETQDTEDFPSGNLSGQQEQETEPVRIGINANKQGAKVSEHDIQRMAASFAERFGSYSNQSGFSNIGDLQVFMTSSMQDWSKKYIEDMKTNNTDLSIYYGITTMAITSEIIDFSEEEGRAEVLVKTQRRESLGTYANSKTFYQDITIIFAEEKGVWKVDNAFWK